MFGLKREKLDMILPARLSWLHWIVLWLVIISFVLFGFVAWGLGGSGGFQSGPGGRADAIDVDGRKISYDRYLRQLRDTTERYRSNFGGQLDPTQADKFLEQLNIPGIVTNSMIQRELALREAETLGLMVTDDELKDHIRKTFVDENGAFLGSAVLERYARRSNQTEEQLKQAFSDDLLLQKYQELLSAGAVVSNQELERQYLEQNDRAEVDYLFLDATTPGTDADPDETTLKAYFEANPSYFEVDERKARYVVLEAADYRSQVTVDEAELRAEYDRRAGFGEYDEQRRARHILLSTSDATGDPAAKAAIEAKAKELTEQARAGADFAALASEHSTDQGSAVNGGDLGFFGRGRMVPSFDEAVFSMEPGQISDPVESNFGFHIIKLEELRPPRTFADVAPALTSDLTDNAARARLREESAALLDGETADLDAIASSLGKTVRETEYFALDNPPEAIEGLAPQWTTSFAAALFGIAEEGGLASNAVIAGDSAALVQLAAKRGPVMPSFASARPAVEQRYRLELGKKRVAETAARVAALLGEGKTLAEVATEVGGELESSAPFARGDAIPGIAGSEAAAKSAYTASLDTVTGPIELEGGTVWFKVTKRFEFDEATFSRELGPLRDRLEQAQNSQNWSALMQSVRQDLERKGRIGVFIPELNSGDQNPVF